MTDKDWEVIREFHDLRASFRRKFLILYRITITLMVLAILEFWMLVYLILK